jgi:hypothetical protein
MSCYLEFQAKHAGCVAFGLHLDNLDKFMDKKHRISGGRTTLLGLCIILSELTNLLAFLKFGKCPTSTSNRAYY